MTHYSTDHLTNHLIVFTRYPQPGKAKTRLIPTLGANGAAALQRQMTEHTLAHIKRLLTTYNCSVEIWFAGTDDIETDRQRMQDWLGAEWCYSSQPPGDLGKRMAYAFQSAFTAGAERVITIGTDCPGLDSVRMQEAFQALQTHDVVLGPATDGGYYLIGLRRFIPELFVGISWSTDTVLSETVAIANQLGLTVAYLDALTDVDRPDDLPVWQAIRNTTPPTISVVIPVLNEANTIAAVIQTLQHSQDLENPTPNLEVIVVDGGSQDDTVALANGLGATVLSIAPGRAQQLNAGAQAATGEILVFLHADTRLPDGWISYVQQTLEKPGVVAGAFELKIDGDPLGLRLVEWGVKWRSRLLQLPYGDQAIFLKADVFHQLGGFPTLAIMEDFVFVRRLRQLGRVDIAPTPVITSARRWQKLGVLKTTLINQIIVIAYYLGVSPERLARWYRGQKNRD